MRTHIFLGLVQYLDHVSYHVDIHNYVSESGDGVRRGRWVSLGPRCVRSHICTLRVGSPDFGPSSNVQKLM